MQHIHAQMHNQPNQTKDSWHTRQRQKLNELHFAPGSSHALRACGIERVLGLPLSQVNLFSSWLLATRSIWITVREKASSQRCEPPLMSMPRGLSAGSAECEDFLIGNLTILLPRRTLMVYGNVTPLDWTHLTPRLSSQSL